MKLKEYSCLFVCRYLTFENVTFIIISQNPLKGSKLAHNTMYWYANHLKLIDYTSLPVTEDGMSMFAT